MEDRGRWDHSKCPQNCGEELEHASHVLQCPKGDGVWRKLQHILQEWGVNSDAAPGLMAALTEGLDQWR
eukprot:12104700-Ditylum_brightwellii.AAC.1